MTLIKWSWTSIQ